MLRTAIGDSRTGTNATVTDSGALSVSQSDMYDQSRPISHVPVGRAMSINGEGLITNLKVNGSVNPIDAYVSADLDGDIYLTRMSIVIADSAVNLNQFGALAALTNGVRLFYEITRGRRIFPLSFKTAFDFIRLATDLPGIGGKTDAFKMANVGTTISDAYAISIDLTSLSPLGFGLRIRKDSTDKFGITIADDLTGLDDFSLICTGYLQLFD